MSIFIRLAYRYFLCMLLGIFLVACGGGTLMVKEEPYIAPIPQNAEETLIYVFRESKFRGGGREIEIVANDTYMAVLTNGSFSQFKVKGESDIVARMTPNRGHFRLKNREGKTIYLLCSVGNPGILVEKIDEQKATELMEELNYVTIGVKNKKSDVNFKTYYDNLYK